MKRYWQRGSSLVETAIVLNLFLVLLLGILDAGRALYTYHLVDNAARIGARFAIVHGSNCAHTASGTDQWPCNAGQTEIQNYVQAQSVVMGLGSPAVAVSWPGGNPGCTASSSPYSAQGCLVKVTVTYTFDPWFPIAFASNIPMSSTSQMIISQ